MQQTVLLALRQCGACALFERQQAMSNAKQAIELVGIRQHAVCNVEQVAPDANIEGRQLTVLSVEELLAVAGGPEGEVSNGVLPP